MEKYNHLTLAERDVITTMLSEKHNLSDIAKSLGRSKSTISRELKLSWSPVKKFSPKFEQSTRNEILNNRREESK